jgi:hypothetical protein
MATVSMRPKEIETATHDVMKLATASSPIHLTQLRATFQLKSVISRSCALLSRTRVPAAGALLSPSLP